MQTRAPQNLDRITDLADRQAQEVSRIIQEAHVFGAF